MGDIHQQICDRMPYALTIGVVVQTRASRSANDVALDNKLPAMPLGWPHRVSVYDWSSYGGSSYGYLGSRRNLQELARRAVREI